MAYFQHRISHWWSVSKKLLDEGYLTIGFRALTGTGILDAKKDGEKFSKIYKENFNDNRRWQVNRFLNLNTGDTVVVPLYNKQFAVVEVTDQCDITDNLPKEVKCRVGFSDEVDLGFFVPIKIVNLTQRSFATSKLQSRMKNQQTNIPIDDLKEDVEQAKSVEGPIDFHNKIKDELSEKMLECIRGLNDRNTEKLVKWYLLKIGATSAKVLEKNSLEKKDYEDADVIAEFEAIGVAIIVQVKAHNGEESNWAVKQIKRYMDIRISTNEDLVYIPWVISTADSFSQEAKDMALEHGIKLIDGLMFAGMLIDSGIESINSELEFS